MKPIHDRIVTIKITPEQKSKGGLILVQSEVDQNRDTCYGKVLHVGDGKQVDGTGKLPMTVKVDDIIVFNERIPLKFPHNGIEYLILRESDVLLVLPPNEFNEDSTDNKTEGSV
jgi:chaperonin GroES